MEKNGLGARNPSVRLVWYESKFCVNKRPKSEVICAGVGTSIGVGSSPKLEAVCTAKGPPLCIRNAGLFFGYE